MSITIPGEVTYISQSNRSSRSRSHSRTNSQGISRESSIGSNGSFHSTDDVFEYNEVGGEIVEILIKEKKCKEIFKLLFNTNLLDLSPPPALGYKTMFGLIGIDFESWYGISLAFTYKTVFKSDIHDDINFLINCIKNIQSKASKPKNIKHVKLYKLIQNKFFNSKLKNEGIKELEKQTNSNAIFLLSVFPDSLQTMDMDSETLDETLLDETSCCKLSEKQQSVLTKKQKGVAQKNANRYISNISNLCRNPESTTKVIREYQDTYGHIPMKDVESEIRDTETTPTKKKSTRKLIGDAMRHTLRRSRENISTIFGFHPKGGSRKKRNYFPI